MTLLKHLWLLSPSYARLHWGKTAIALPTVLLVEKRRMGEGGKDVSDKDDDDEWKMFFIYVLILNGRSSLYECIKQNLICHTSM